jgi:hypothetical protein
MNTSAWKMGDRLFWACLVFVLVCSAITAATAGDLTNTLEGYRSMSLSDTGVPIDRQIFEIGHLRVQLVKGTAYPLQGNNGDTLGFFFEGPCSYKYAIADPLDRQVVARNAQNRGVTELFNDYTFSDSADRMLVFFGQPIAEHLWSATGKGAAAATEAHRKNYAAIWNRIQKTYLEYDHFSAEARLNGGDRQFIYAEFEGSKKTVGYTYDRLRNFKERFFTFRKFGGYDLRFKARLSSQLIDGGPQEQPTPVTLIDAKFDVSTPDNRFVTIISDLTFETGISVKVVPLLLDNHRDPNAYDWTSDINQLRTTRVTDAMGKDLDFSHRNHEILVELPETVPAEQKFQLHFETEGEFLTGMDFERIDDYFELFSGNWYPTPFVWGASGFTMSVKFRTKKPYRPIASGKVTDFHEEGDAYVLEAHTDEPVNIIALIAGRYTTAEKVFDGFTVRAHAYGRTNKKYLENMPKLAYAMMRYYEDLLVPYPFEELEIVEVPAYGFGIAPSGMVLLTSQAYQPRQAELMQYSSRGNNALLAHELAHQWFGHIARPAGPRDTWLSESFAEYVSGLAIASMAGKSRKMFTFDDMFKQWWNDAIDCRDAGPISGANMLSGEGSLLARYRLLYSKGPLVLRMLHSQIGNDRFYQILRTFLNDADMSSVTTEDFVEATEKVMGTDMGWFFRQWINEGGLPEIKIDYEILSSGEGQPVLAGSATLQEGHALKKMSIPLVLEFDGGQPQVRWIQMDQPTTSFRFDLPARPNKVKVDPARNFLAVFK